MHTNHAATRLIAIRQACNLQSDLRTDEHIDDIVEFVKDVKFFSKLTLVQQRALCRTMSIEEFASREHVFEIGDVGSKYYIILSGSVGVQIYSQTAPCPTGIHSQTESCNCAGRPLDTVVILEPRMGFGELSLQSDLPRSATIQAFEHTELLVTEKEDYQTYAGQLHRQFIEHRVAFLRGCPRIEEALQRMLVTTQDIGLMANCLQEKSLNGNGVACRQGDPVDQMIFVRSGSLAIIRVVDVDAATCCDKEQFQDNSTAYLPGVSTCRKHSYKEQTAATSSSARSPSIRPGSKGVTSFKDGRDSFDEGDRIPASQTEHQLANNLAKLMRDVKKKERDVKRDELMEKGVLTKNEHKWEASGAVARDRTASIERRSKGNQIKKKASVQMDSDGGNGETKKPTGSCLWKKVSKAVGLANNQNRFLAVLGGIEGGGATTVSEETAEQNLQAAQRSIEHLSSVSRARKRYDEVRFKDMREKSSKSLSHSPSRGSRSGFSDCKKRKLLLRVGTVGPNQFFGDQQICSTETYQATLVSDPVAELYVMSKHDIFRRLPKKLFSALFAPDQEKRATDAQLLDMHRQVERWGAFRKAMHREAMSQVGLRNHGMSVHRPLRDPCSSARIDPLANLDFLGVHPRSTLGKHLAQTPTRGPACLTAKDEELFSQASARFLRRVDIVTRDPGLHSALAKMGQQREVLVDRGHEGRWGSESGGHSSDPMSFRFEQHWAKLRKDQIGLDLDSALEDEPKASTHGSPSTRVSVSRPKGSLAVASSSGLLARPPPSVPWGGDVSAAAEDRPPAPQSAREKRADGQVSPRFRPQLSARGWTSTSGSQRNRTVTTSLPARHHGRHAPISASPPEPSGMKPSFMRRSLQQ